MAVKTNNAAGSYGSELGRGAPALIGMDAELNCALRGAYRGTDIAANNMYDRGRTDSRFSGDRREGQRPVDSRFSEDYGEGLPFI